MRALPPGGGPTRRHALRLSDEGVSRAAIETAESLRWSRALWAELEIWSALAVSSVLEVEVPSTMRDYISWTLVHARCANASNTGISSHDG